MANRRDTQNYKYVIVPATEAKDTVLSQASFKTLSEQRYSGNKTQVILEYDPKTPKADINIPYKIYTHSEILIELEKIAWMKT